MLRGEGRDHQPPNPHTSAHVSRDPRRPDGLRTSVAALDAASQPIARLAFALALLLPSVPEAREAGGLPGVCALLLVGTATIAALPALARFAEARLSPRVALFLAGLAIAFALVAAGLAYPVADVHVPGSGSDRDDALRDATNALLDGRHPYGAATYLGNPITPLPGALLLATPFVIANAVWLQNIFWLGAFFLLARNRLGDERQALLLLCVVMATPAVAHEVSVGGDLLANGIYVAVGLAFVAGTTTARSAPWRAVAAAVFLGVALASRLTYPYVLPLVFAFAWRLTGPRRAFLRTATAAVTFALLTLPLYLWSPDRFAPLHMRTKVMRVADVIPRPDIVVPLIAVAGALVVCVRLRPVLGALLLRAAAVVALPTTVLLVASIPSSDAPTLEYLAMGLGYLPLAVLALAPHALGRPAPDR